LSSFGDEISDIVMVGKNEFVIVLHLRILGLVLCIYFWQRTNKGIIFCAFFVYFRSFRSIRVVLYFVRAMLQVALLLVVYQGTVFITDIFTESHNATLKVG